MNINKKKVKGRLVGHIGPMYAQKSTRLMGITRQWTIAGVSWLMFKHSLDTRYPTSSGDMNVSHDGLSCVATSCSSLDEITQILEKLPGVTHVAIDEVQFFLTTSNGVQWFLDQVETRGRTIVFSGLNLKYDKTPWDGIAELSMQCDELHHLKAICAVCYDTKAPFTKRLVDSKKDIDVGGTDKYIPVCRDCHSLNGDFIRNSPEIQSYLERVRKMSSS